MATTRTIHANSRTPESVVIELANDGAADGAPLELLKADLLAALRPGPLYELINRTADLTALNFAAGNAAKEDFVRITRLAGGLAATVLPPVDVVALYFSATGLMYSIWTNGLDGPVASGLLVELRALHANER